ncbi:hypothetical protein E2C01_090667 [Portunus trituberculatus]|uniref:Uncharacterized protein n=1 Tax=Portunus trituberculatus TaxID=210409 RepID=A0A5B7JLH5_PORTR|nr:hypothetical protein [Portunus trituberculatus]
MDTRLAGRTQDLLYIIIIGSHYSPQQHKGLAPLSLHSSLSPSRGFHFASDNFSHLVSQLACLSTPSASSCVPLYTSR